MSFTASPIVSPFPDQNALFDPAKAIETGQTIQQNQLHMQGQQIDLSNANMAQVGQAAAGLLSAYPDEASRAAAYPRVVGMLQSQGYALHAPSEYPGEGVLRSMVNQSIPAKDLYSSGALLTPAQQAALGQTGQTGTTSTAAPGTPTGAAAPSSVPIPARGTGGPGASASAPTEWLPYFEEASKETGIPVDLLLAQARQESSFNPNAKGTAGEIGLFQIKPSTAAAPAGMQGVDPASLTGPDNVRNNIMFGARYLKAQMGGGDPNNPAVQAAALRRYNGTGPGGDPDYVKHVFGYRPTLAPSDPNAAVTAYTPPTAGATTATAAPTAAQPGQPVPTQVASNTPMVSTAPPGSTAAPGGPPAAQPVAAAVPPAPPAQPGQPAQPQAAPAAAAAAAPASTSRLPDASTIPTGRNSAAWQQAQQLIDKGNQMLIVAGSNAGMRASAERMIQQGTQQQQLDHMVPAQQDGRPGNLNTTTGQFTPYAPLPSPRFSQPTIDPATGKPAIAAVSGSGTQYFPIPASPAQGDYENMKTAYNGDVSTIKDVSTAGRAAQASALQLNELADVIKNVQSGGVLPEFRAKVAALMEANGAKPETIEAYTGMKSGSDAQVLQKLAVATIGASAKADLGSNVGVESLNLYSNANPGMDKLQDANKRVTNMIRVAREQIESYSLGAQQHFNQNQSTMLHTPAGQVPDYHPLSEYNQQWQAQNNPQIGAAAIGILNGDGFDKWAARAGPEEALNAVRLAARIDPNIQIPVKGGGFKTAQEVLSHGTGQ